MHCAVVLHSTVMAEDRSDASPNEPGPAPRTLSVDLADIGEHWDVDDKVAALWRSARLGPNVERLRRHVLQGGEQSMESGQFRALDAIAANGPCPVSELASVMGLEPSTVTRATAKLESAGLIKKTRAERDHRQVLLELTDDGVSKHQFFVDRAYQVYQEIFAVFTTDERVLLADLLERMLKSTDLTLADIEDRP